MSDKKPYSTYVRIKVESADHYEALYKEAIEAGYDMDKAECVPELLAVNKKERCVLSYKYEKYLCDGMYYSYHAGCDWVTRIGRKKMKPRGSKIYVTLGPFNGVLGRGGKLKIKSI